MLCCSTNPTQCKSDCWIFSFPTVSSMWEIDTAGLRRPKRTFHLILSLSKNCALLNQCVMRLIPHLHPCVLGRSAALRLGYFTKPSPRQIRVQTGFISHLQQTGHGTYNYWTISLKAIKLQQTGTTTTAAATTKTTKKVLRRKYCEKSTGSRVCHRAGWRVPSGGTALTGRPVCARTCTGLAHGSSRANSSTSDTS